jgi:hypothetical protein
MTVERFDRKHLIMFATTIPRELHAAARAAALDDGTRFWLWITEALEEHLAAVRGSEEPPDAPGQEAPDVVGETRG